MSETVIEIERFTFSLGWKVILRDITVSVHKSDFLSIIGPNGAGKTTLLKCLTRILSGGSGTITVCGKSLETYRQKDLAKLVSYVPQLDGRTLPFTVEEFVSLGRYPYLSPFRRWAKKIKSTCRR